MNLSAEILSTFQRCKRRHVLEREWRPLRWHPKTLLEAVLWPAIREISAGQSVIITSQTACNTLMGEAAHAGLDTLHDPYTLAKDFCAIINTVLEAISRLSLLVVTPGKTVELGDSEHCWKISAFQDESGILHRWAFVDKWNQDAMYRELHSWHCFGDCAAAQSGMMLHVVEIGRHSKGHQHTDWCRAYKHPVIHGKYRFRKVDGTALEKSWIPVWYHGSNSEPKGWVDLMEADKVSLIHHLNINEPHKTHIEQFRKEVDYEAERMKELGEWQTVPMSRPACDIPYPCPWQDVCYAHTGIIAVDSIGGYNRL